MHGPGGHPPRPLRPDPGPQGSCARLRREARTGVRGPLAGSESPNGVRQPAVCRHIPLGTSALLCHLDHGGNFRPVIWFRLGYMVTTANLSAIWRLIEDGV